MRRLIGRGLALLVVVVLSCAAILAVMPQPDNTFYAAAADKWRAAEQAGSPKVLVVGGSNTVFSLDSRAIAEAVGMPVINMGLNAGLGLRYMLDEAKRFTGPGDIVLISPEYEQFYGPTIWGSQQLVELAWLHPPSLTLMTSPRQWAALAAGFPNVFQSRLRSAWLDFRSPGRDVHDEVYNRDAFNELGDVVSHLGVDSDRPVSDMNLLRDTTSAFNPAAARLLEHFDAEAEERGARLVIAYPTIPAYHYERSEDRIVAIHERLTEQTDVTVLAHPSLHTAPDEDFFDTAYHLSERGREQRTRLLATLLREWLDQ